MSTSNKITLTSSDGESFETDEAVARESQTVANMMEDDCASGSIPLANVASKPLGAAIESCKTHVEAGAVENDEEAADEQKKWDEDFLARYDELCDRILAANCLYRQKLLADIKDLQTEETFKIKNDFWEEEEEAEVRKENELGFK